MSNYIYTISPNLYRTKFTLEPSTDLSIDSCSFFRLLSLSSSSQPELLSTTEASSGLRQRSLADVVLVRDISLASLPTDARYGD
ncbi:hypothetical protein Hanom_Chr15g01414621 [Helianthus anomalus]